MRLIPTVIFTTAVASRVAAAFNPRSRRYRIHRLPHHLPHHGNPCSSHADSGTDHSPRDRDRRPGSRAGDADDGAAGSEQRRSASDRSGEKAQGRKRHAAIVPTAMPSLTAKKPRFTRRSTLSSRRRDAGTGKPPGHSRRSHRLNHDCAPMPAAALRRRQHRPTVTPPSSPGHAAFTVTAYPHSIRKTTSNERGTDDATTASLARAVRAGASRLQ